ncbi:ABC transporter substrate-binding protein [Prosthecochloris ethylica]|uniref:ABC transporter substrate-binding protein n=1 Tax=Prosthecochloris ethylica TaxID=2743976 RepID=UPI00237AFEAF|nr:ABC transporter substrate-binding protein [Prosthecochloris ethylica]
MIRTSRVRIRAGLCCLLLLFFSAASFGQQKPERSLLRIGYIPIAECLPLYVAVEKGFFDKYGIEVELVAFGGGAKILDEIEAGNLDAGISNMVSFVRSLVRGEELYSVFGATYETECHQEHALLVNTDIIKRADDLRGVTVAVNSFRNIDELMVRMYLDGTGLRWDEVNVIEVGFPDMASMLQDGRIAMASIVEPYTTLALQDECGRVEKIANHYLGFSASTLVTTYVSSGKAIREKTDVLRGFVQAMRQATSYISAHDGEVRAFIGTYTSVPSELLDRIGLPEFGMEPRRMAINAHLQHMKRFGCIDSSAALPDTVVWSFGGVQPAAAASDGTDECR